MVLDFVALLTVVLVVLNFVVVAVVNVIVVNDVVVVVVVVVVVAVVVVVVVIVVNDVVVSVGPQSEGHVSLLAHGRARLCRRRAAIPQEYRFGHTQVKRTYH